MRDETMDFSEYYYRDPYKREFDGKVLSCTRVKKGYEVILDDTLFYPEGGGQPCDKGIITYDGGDVKVLDVRRDEERGIIHLLDGMIPEGTEIHGSIDWDYRFSLMQNHTGEHIISGLIHRTYGYENVGFHMGDVLTIDLSGEMSWEEAEEIERRANRVIWDNREVRSVFPDEEALSTLEYRSKKELKGKVRLINIDNADSCACCGIHVKRTGEIGLIKLLSLIRYKGGVRIEMICGDKALYDYEKKLNDNTEIKNLLSVKPEETVGAVKRIMEESIEKSERIAGLNARYAELKICSLSPDNGIIIDLEEDMNGIELRKFCDRLNKTGKAKVSVVLSPSGDDKKAFQYVIAGTGYDLKSLAGSLNNELNGRGGGSKEMIQGTFFASYDRISDAVFKLFR